MSAVFLSHFSTLCFLMCSSLGGYAGWPAVVRTPSGEGVRGHRIYGTEFGSQVSQSKLSYSAMVRAFFTLFPAPRLCSENIFLCSES